MKFRKIWHSGIYDRFSAAAIASVHCTCYVHYVVNNVQMVNSERQLVRDGLRAVQNVFDDLAGFTFRAKSEARARGAGCDAILQASSAEVEFEIGINVKARITPQTALSVVEQVRSLPAEMLRVVYAPVISPRVAELLDRSSIGCVDAAGNCRFRSRRHRLLIDRRGRRAPPRLPQGAADPFSPKSSRIVRAVLSEPAKGWKVRELANHPDVKVSPGLVVKVKRTLVEESYAVERDGLLYLRDPVGLLENWTPNYPGPAEQVPMYFLGETETAEEAVARWCRAHDLNYALGGHSAAWRLAPEVRYSVAAVYVEQRGFSPDVLDKLSKYKGGKRVDTGANLLLWRPFDQSVLAGRHSVGASALKVTSAIQTFLDLKKLTGRGEEAAAAIYDRLLAGPLRDAAQRWQEAPHDQL